MSEDLFPWQRSNLWEPIFFIFWVHSLNLLSSWGTENFNNLNKLVDSTFTWENRLTKHELSNNASAWPDVNGGGVVWISKNQLRCSVVPGADVGHIGLSLYELFSTSEVTKFENVRVGITQNVLRFDVSMANSLGMDVGNGPHQLICVDLHNERRDHLFHLEVLFHYSVSRVGNIIHDNIQIDFIRLVTISIETLTHFNTIGMM